MRVLPLSACCVLSLAGVSSAAAADPKDIACRAVQRNVRNDQLARQYTYLQHNDVRTLDGSGQITERERKTFDITLLEGSPYHRLIAKDDKPLPPGEEKKQQELLNQSIEQRRKETPEQRQQRIADWERKRDRERENLAEVCGAFDFHLVGEEQFDGVPVWVIDATPHPGYKPKSREASYFPKINGRIWVAKSDYTPVKIVVETLDTISVGAFLIRLAKGGRIDVEYARVNDEVWLPKSVNINASVRLLLVKAYHLDADYTFNHYKKFSAESRIVDTGQ
jgi:hypothetical protein